ncbi:hypothetical protein MU0083_000277 [[Mycobacterium] kokjensenii]|uniref:Serine/threonine protein kinase n=1 Tax=[Mycobacterium] kokjensenii TaxID=3064287 RepID=A0ABM9L6N7_9MYCO|nr:hypothetical protein [Mycolicibacter sp. MU0083]CAJ1493357.1 hypothetical protein MU0083_000277 [Mycolicibacter sp. MU0083]
MASNGSSGGPRNPSDDETRAFPHSRGVPQRPGPSPAPFGPPGPSPRPGDTVYQPAGDQTRYAPFNAFDTPPQADNANFAAPVPTPWYRRRSVLAAWFGLIAVMLALVIWGIIQLTSRGPSSGGTGSQTSSSSSSTTTSSSTTSSTTSTTSSSTTSTSSSAPSTTAPPAAPPPRQQQPPAQQAPVPSEEPRHRHPRLPSLPSVITIPPIPKVPEIPTVITLPPHR